MRQSPREFGVNAKTIARWAREGKLPCIRTLGGHRRFRVSDIAALAAFDVTPGPDADGDGPDV